MLRIESGLYFANADTVRRQILHAASEDGTRTVVLDAETTPYIDVSAAQMPAALAHELRSRSVSLLIARDVGQFRDVVEHAPGDSDLPLSYRASPTGSRPADARVRLSDYHDRTPRRPRSELDPPLSATATRPCPHRLTSTLDYYAGRRPRRAALLLRVHLSASRTRAGA